MDFQLTADQEMLAKTAGAFAKQSSPVTRFRALRDNAVGYEKSVWRQMGELGWLGVAFPESMGGLGGTFVDVALILEKLGATLVPEPLIPSVVLGGMALRLAGNAEQHKRWLEPMMEGKTTLALAYAERNSRFDLERIETRAERAGSGYKLTGQKSFVLNGHAADQVIVSAKGPDGLSLFVIDAGSPGFKAQPIRTLDGQRAAIVTLEGATIEAERVLGVPGSSKPVLEHVLDYAAAAACAEGLGICQTVLELTVDYLKTREQFEVKIGTFQALQHRAVEMFVEVELVRSMNILAAASVDHGNAPERARDISAAKAHLAASGKHVTQQAIQLFGGVGITDEHDIGLYFKRMHALNTLFGDEEHHLERLASLPTFAAD